MSLLKRFISSIRTRFKSLTGNPSAWFQLGVDLFQGFFSKRTRRELYYGIVYSCVDAIATAVSSNKLKLYLDNGDGSPDEVIEDPILIPLKKANKFQTGADVIYMVSAHIEAHGLSYLWPVKNVVGYPFKLFAIDPSRVRIAYNYSATMDEDYIRGYVYTALSGAQVPFEVDELIPIVRPNPFSQNPLDGISTIEMARLEAEADLDAQLSNRKFFERGARPSGIFTTENSISDQAFDRIKKQVQENYEGTENMHRMWILENGLNFQQTSISQKDMDFVEGRKLSRDAIMAIFKVPKVVLAISDDVNRANAEAGDYVFAKRVEKPHLDLIVSKLNAHYVPMFPNSERKFISFDNPVPEDEETKTKSREVAVYKWKTINEIRAEDKLPPVPGGDVLYTPINLIPINESSDPEGNEPKSKPEEPKKESLESIFAKAIKSTARERRYIKASRDYKTQREKQMALTYAQLIRDLAKAVERKKSTKQFNLKQGEEQESIEMILSATMPKMDEFGNLVADVTLRYNTDTFNKSLENIKEFYELPVNFDLVHSGALTYLKTRASETASSMRETMLNRAREIISQELSEPEFTVDKVRQRIVTVFRDEAEWRSQRIARTEVQTAYSEAAYRTYGTGGMVEKLKWIVSIDPCDLCKQNKGKSVTYGDPFPSGHTHPIVHPNCACDVVPDFGI
jgi:HK97 family phage portal protein